MFFETLRLFHYTFVCEVCEVTDKFQAKIFYSNRTKSVINDSALKKVKGQMLKTNYGK